MCALKKFLFCVGIILLVGSTVVLIALSLKRIEFNEVGVKYDTAGKKLGNDVSSAGLYSGVPGFVFLKFPAVYKSIHFPDLKCFTFDGAFVTLDVQYQFKIIDKEIPNILTRFRDYDKYLELLKSVGKSQFYKSCSRFSAYGLVADRVEFARVSEELLKQKYDGLYTHISGLQINNIALPDEYNDAQKRKEAVRENIQVKLKERPERLTEAEEGRERALAQAQIRLQNAETEARTTLTKASNEAAVIRKQALVDGEIYLKLQTMGVGDLQNYLAVEALSSGQNPVKVNFKYP